MSFSGTKDPSNAELRRLVEQLLEEVATLRERVFELEAENAALKEENARLKGHKGRPKLKPSGMEKATSGAKAKAGRKTSKRASRRSVVVSEEQKLSTDVPAGSRFKGYDDFPWLALAAGQPERLWFRICGSKCGSSTIGVSAG